MNYSSMKHKLKRKLRQVLSVIISTCIVLCTVGYVDFGAFIETIYAEDIIGITHTYEFDGCLVTYKVNNSWSNYVTAEMTISNTGNTTIRDWEITFDYEGTIDNIWSAAAWHTDNEQYVITPMTYNREIYEGNSVSFGFMAYGTEKAPSAPKELSVKGVQKKPESEEISIWKALEYAVFTGSSKTLSLYTGTTRIGGDVHSNKDFYYQGNTITVDGKIETAGTARTNTSDSETAVEVSEFVENASVIEMAPLTQVIKTRLATDGCIYEESQNFNTPNVIIDKSIYVKGSAFFNTTSFLGSGIIHATDSISVNVGEMSTPGNTRVFLSSENGDITLNGTDFEINAVLYAPNGCVRINAGNIKINGRIIASSLEINGNVFNINATDADFDVLRDVLSPEGELGVSGDTKENRRVIIELTDMKGFEHVDTGAIKWSFEKDGENAEELVGFDDDKSTSTHREMLFYEAGEYRVKVTVNDGTGDYNFVKNLTITPDIAPVAGIKENSENDGFYLRNEEGNVTVSLDDISYSPDEDVIGNRVWKIFHDSNNDGAFAEDELVYTADGDNSTHAEYTAGEVGKYKVLLTVREYFTNTIPQLIGEEDYLKDTAEMYFEVGNLKPSAAFDIKKAKRADIVLTVGAVTGNKIEVADGKLNELKEELTANGVDVNLISVESSTITAKDTFAWKEFDHINYEDRYLPTIEKHIIYDGNDIVMTGYSQDAAKDFLYVDDDDPSDKIFDFTMVRDGTDWHSMEGAGFLFNTKVDEENNTINGYAVIFGQSGCKVVRIDCDDLEGFRNGEYKKLQHAGELLVAKTTPSTYVEHNYVIKTSKNTISVWIDGKNYLDEYILPQEAESYGYGPITSHGSHACSQRSYFTFSGITMKAVTGKKLDEIVNENIWRNGAGHFLINISDVTVAELNDELKMAEVSKSLIENEVTFAGIGNDTNREQFVKLISNSENGGMNITGDDFGENIGLLCERIKNDILSRDYSIESYICTDEPVDYLVNYNDPENDVMGSAKWDYEYDPNAFGENVGERQHITATFNEPVREFENAGAYAVSLSVQDNAAGENENLTDYNEWSDISMYEKLLLVQNRPTGEIGLDLSAPKYGSSCYANMTLKAEDADHPGDEAKGIRQEEISYKLVGDAQWTMGKLPNMLNKKKIYLVKYIVADVEGSVSRPAVAIADTNQFRTNEEIYDNEPPVITLKTGRDRYAVGENIIIDAYASDENGVNNFLVYVNNKMVRRGTGYVNYVPETAGEITVHAVATDIKGNKSEKSIVLYAYTSDVTAPYAELAVNVKDGEQDKEIQFIGTATDETQLRDYVLEYCKLSENEDNEYELIVKGDKNVTDEILSSIPVSQLDEGEYRAKLTVTDKAGNKTYCTAEFEINITQTPGSGETPQEPGSGETPQEPGGAENTDKQVPTATFALPEAETTLTEPVYITGTVEDETELADYTLEYKLVDEKEYTLLDKGCEPVKEDVLGYFDVTTVENGVYEMRLTATDTSGNRIRTTRKYIVLSDYKSGEMFFGYTDASNYIAGAMVNVNRYYSSLNKRSGDFGYGWSLGLAGLKMYETNSLTSGYGMTQTGNYFNSHFEMEQRCGHDVIIDYGDGTSDRFVLKVTPQSSDIIPVYEIKLEFECVTSRDVKLEFVTDTTARVYSNQFMFYDERMYDDIEFVLTSKEGTRTYFTENRGVTRIETSSGVNITVDSDGYHADNNKGITLTRDENGRIISLKNIYNQITTYTYDEAGNLIAVTDPAKRTVSYEYDENHNIIKIIDPMGIATARNEYDESGRLIAVTDANGNRTEVEYDTAGRCQVVRDAIGNASILTYDAHGNILKKVDPYGNTTENEYDENNNLIKTTDALGHTTTYDRDDNGNVIKITAADGSTVEGTYTQGNYLAGISVLGNTLMSLEYDEVNKMTSITDAYGNEKYFEYDSKGLLTGITDSIGTYQRATYDSNGNVVSTTNGAGDTATFKYDLKGRCTSKTISRQENGETLTFVSRYSYNDAGELISSTDNAGNKVSYTYDNNGNVTASIDEKGRRTTYDYDETGNIIKITYADKTYETFTYDANMNNISATNRRGQTVTMEYDKLNRLVAVNYADNTRASYEYDAVGNVTAAISVTGARTEYVYDSRNRNIAIKDGLSNETTFAYNETSQLISATDALGNTTSYEYDLNGNITKVTYADQNSVTAEYDARNRLISCTDQKGNRTCYTYDAADRLIKVTDALGGTYEYTYDANGNLRQVTSANKNVTLYDYDKVGRIAKITNAAGKSVCYTYDATGNIVTGTDFAGTVTTYRYDSRDRLIKKTVGSDVTTYKYSNMMS